MNLPELLSPAGTFEALDAALRFGANAVYLGLDACNLRSGAGNFTTDDLPDVFEKASETGAKIYITLNAMPFDAQLPQVEAMLDRIRISGILPNAFIVSDPGVIRLCRRILPAAELHLSTQTGVFNAESLAFWKDEGISRVVLPREMSLDQIIALVKQDILPLEIFCHGAMCMAISGRCLMGAYMYGRHPNQGDCPQPCRFSYSVNPVSTGRDGEGIAIDIEEDGEATYLMNSKDLCALPILDKLVKSGIVSLKIEGRNRSAQYVAAATRIYRSALDAIASEGNLWSMRQEWVDELNAIDHREYTTGFFCGETAMQDRAVNRRPASLRVAGVVKAIDGCDAIVDVKNGFNNGADLSLLPITLKKGVRIVKINSLRDFGGRELTRAKTNSLVRVTNDSFREGDILRVAAS